MDGRMVGILMSGWKDGVVDVNEWMEGWCGGS